MEFAAIKQAKVQIMQRQPYFSGFDSISVKVAAQLMPEAIPLHARPCSATDAVIICVHGFTSNPYEISPVADALANAGLAAVVPLLPGHGYREHFRQRQEFAKITKDAMLNAVRQEIARAREQYSQVGMLGFSMGGAIALSMAAEGLLDACAVVAPAIRLPLKGEILIPLLSWARFTLNAPVKDPFYLPVYTFHHSRALRSLWQLSRHARSQLPKIQCPILGIHSYQDPVVPPIVLDIMQERIPNAIEMAWFDHSGHVMQLDVSGDAVAAKIADFFKRQFLSLESTTSIPSIR